MKAKEAFVRLVRWDGVEFFVRPSDVNFVHDESKGDDDRAESLCTVAQTWGTHSNTKGTAREVMKILGLPIKVSRSPRLKRRPRSKVRRK